MEKVLFKEEQRFTQGWIWYVIVICIWGPVLFPVYSLMNERGNDSADIWELLFVLFLVIFLALGFTWLFVKMKLMLEINTDGIRFKFFPFHLKYKDIKKEEIERFEVRTYRPVSEYGGWGIKGGKKSKGMAYNVRGNIGLQLYLKTGKKILFGTQKKQAIERAMNKLIQKEMDN